MKVPFVDKQIKNINSLKHPSSSIHETSLTKHPNKSKFSSSVQILSKPNEQFTKTSFHLVNDKRFHTDSNQYPNHQHFSSCEITLKPDLGKILSNKTISTEDNNSSIKANRFAHSMKNILDKPKPVISIKKEMQVPNCTIFLNTLTNNSVPKHTKSISNNITTDSNIRTIPKDIITQPKLNKPEQLKHIQHNNEISSLVNSHFHKNKSNYIHNKCFTPMIHDNHPIKTIEYKNTFSHKHYNSSPSPNKRITYGNECYKIMKSIYNKIKQEEKFYNPDFNYKFTDYDSVNNSICDNNDKDDNKLLSLCYKLKEEILNTLAQLVDNFEKVKKSLMNKHKTTLEENKSFYKEITTYKEAIRDYLVCSGNPNTNVTKTNELINIFTKTYNDFRKEFKRKIEEREQLIKDLRSIKIKDDNYKQIINVSQNKINILKKENELVLMNYNTKHNYGDVTKELIVLRNEKVKMEKIIKENEQLHKLFIKTIVDVMKRLMDEIDITIKVKECLNFVFKLAGLNENEINEMYMLKERKHKVNNVTCVK